jgi:hypothetical protein
MGRTILAVVIVGTCLWPSRSDAQTGAGSRGGSVVPRGGSSGAGTRQIPPPPPSPSVRPGQRPLPPGVPLVPPAPPSAAPIGPYASPSALDRDIFQARPRTYAPQYSRSRGFFYGGYGSGYSGGYVTDPFGYIGQPDSSAPALDRYMRGGDSPEGYLRLEVEPESAQVFVDGLYAGTVSDFRRGGGRTLDAGPHRIEFRAEGYDTQGVELRIRANDVLSYRGTLTRRDTRADTRAAATPKTFYVIPRCYAGTSRPRADQLPAGCQLKDLRTIPPVVTPQ